MSSLKYGTLVALLALFGLAGCGRADAPTQPAATQAADNVADATPQKQGEKRVKAPRNKPQSERLTVRAEKRQQRREEKQRKITEAEAERANPTIPNSPPPLGEKQPNIVLVTIDTLRADHLGCYGYARETSKTIDKLAKEGVVFENAYAQRNSTWPSLASIMTSMHPVSHGVRHNGLQLTSTPLTLAEVLHANGYNTAAVYTNSKGQNWEGFQVRHPVTVEPFDERATHEAVSWVKDVPTPFFLWIHYLAPHSDYEPPAAFNTFVDPNYSGQIAGDKLSIGKATLKQIPVTEADIQHVRDLYDGEISYADNELNKLLDALRARSLLDNTLVAVSADHGEELWDHHGYFGHGASVYEGVMHVPLVIRLPGTIPAGQRVPTLVSSIDIAPTILDTVGIKVPETYQGRSLSAVFKGETLSSAPSFAEFKDKILMVRSEEYAYVYNPTDYHPRKIADEKQVKIGAGEDALIKNEELDATMDLKEGTYRKEDLFTYIKSQELYNTARDRYEKQEISAEYPEIVARMQKDLDNFREKYHWKVDDGTDARIKNEIAPEVKDELQAMGYIMNESEGEKPEAAPKN